MTSRPAAPISAASPILYSDPLPAETDVVVIGGGVIGVAAALYVNRLGLKPFICEKGRIAGEQSSRNWGWIRQLGRDEDELPVMMEASRLWEQLDAETDGRTGFRRSGILYLSSTRTDLDRQAAWIDIARRHQLDVRQLDGAAVTEIVDAGANGKRWIGGLWSPTDARAEPWQAVPAIAGLARAEGVGVREACAVRALEIAAGRVAGVHTEHGFIACAQVVVAGGAWSSLFLRRHGVTMPQLSVVSTVARTAPLPDIYSGNALDEDLAFRRREDGGYTLSALGSHDLFLGPDAVRHLKTWLPVAASSAGDTRLRLASPRDFPDGWRTARNWTVDEQTPFERCRVLDPAPDPRGTE
jgi:glycine/D-amino acid oxidase-like deaminating enzyme